MLLRLAEWVVALQVSPPRLADAIARRYADFACLAAAPKPISWSRYGKRSGHPRYTSFDHLAGTCDI